MMDLPKGSCDKVREKLALQYVAGDYPADAGLSKDELKAWVENYLNAHSKDSRIKTRAAIFSFLLGHARVRVDEFDVFADHIDAGWTMREIQLRWQQEAAKGIPSSPWVSKKVGFPSLDLSHTSPGWRNILKLGIAGTRERALQGAKQAKDAEAQEFFNATASVYKAIGTYALRLAAEAERKGALRVSDCLKGVAERPPKTLYEALQVAYLYRQAQEIEGENLRTEGNFDRLYFDFYSQDLRSGELTRESAKELLNFYFDKFAAQGFGAGHNFCLGGKNPDGSDACNELTELVLEIFEERKNIDPKLSLRLNANTPERILRQASRCVAQGTNAIVFANDDVAYPMFLKRGKSPDELLDFTPVGCYEPAIMGKEMCCSMSALLNMAKIAELLFEGDWEPKSFSDVVKRVEELLTEAISSTLDITRRWEKSWPQVNPSPVLSGAMDACFEKGRDVSNAGAKYNSSGVMCAGLGTLADSLAAIELLVFERKLCSWKELRAILAADWEGQENLRLAALKRAPKWGNNSPEVDKLAVSIASHVARQINATKNARGGFFQAGCWSIDNAVTFGRDTGATPDGRKRGAPLSKNAGPSLAADVKGSTALLASVAKLDHTEFPDGSVVDVMLHPSALRGNDGAGVVASLVKAYFHDGGLFVHFNIFDAETLKMAQKEPEKYRNLQVRVCGWNSRFVDLTPEMQGTFIAQAEVAK